MKHQTVIQHDALFKRYRLAEDMWREWQALQDCRGFRIQEVLTVDEQKLELHFVFDPQARNLCSFKHYEEKLFIRVLPEVLRAIRHCHTNGWVHGDIKPSNILFIPQTCSVRLVDFGASQSIGTNRSLLKRWQVTPQFASEEQNLGIGFVQPKEDWLAIMNVITQVLNITNDKSTRAQLNRIGQWVKLNTY